MSTATAPRSRTNDDAGNGSDFDNLVNAPAKIDRADLLMMKMENESIMAECRVHPRNLSAVKQELLEQLEAFPDLATDAIYCKPIGGSDKVRGLGIRAAEALAEAYGYNRIRSDVTPLDNLTVKVEATFTDYQKGRVWQDGGILSKQYKMSKAKGGGIAFYDDDRFYNVVCKSEISKRIREVILRSVNSGLKKWFEAECERRIGELLTDAVVQKWVDGFKDMGVSLAQLETFIGRKRELGWTKSDKANLLGVWNALENNETTVAEAFGAMEPKKEATPGRKTLTDLLPAEGKEPGGWQPAEYDACKTLKEARAVYDKYCGPDSTLSEQDIVDAAAYFDVTTKRITK